jgi:hypothetical protein
MQTGGSLFHLVLSQSHVRPEGRAILGWGRRPVLTAP